MTRFVRPRPDKHATQFLKNRAWLKRRDLEKPVISQLFLRPKMFSQLSLNTRHFLEIYLLFCILELPNLGLFDWQMQNCFGSDGKKQHFESDYKTGLLESLATDPTLMPLHVDQLKNHKCLQLRPYAGETKLLLCCGNGNQQYDCCGEPLINPRERVAYRKEHRHTGWFTIDVMAQTGPHIVANVSTATYPMLPDGVMKTVMVEQSRFYITPTFVAEMTRLLVECGTITHVDGKVFARKIAGELCFCASDHSFNGYPDVFDYSDIYGCDDDCPCKFAMDSVSTTFADDSDCDY
jgi:hypothetical protein